MECHQPFDIVGEYAGRVVPPVKGGEYVATIDWEDRWVPFGLFRLSVCGGGKRGSTARIRGVWQSMGCDEDRALVGGTKHARFWHPGGGEWAANTRHSPSDAGSRIHNDRRFADGAGEMWGVDSGEVRGTEKQRRHTLFF